MPTTCGCRFEPGGISMIRSLPTFVLLGLLGVSAASGNPGDPYRHYPPGRFCASCGPTGGCLCVPNARYFGYFPTLWRTWPCEPRPNKAFPQAVGAEPIFPPPAENLPLPAQKGPKAPEPTFDRGYPPPPAPALPSAPKAAEPVPPPSPDSGVLGPTVEPKQNSALPGQTQSKLPPARDSSAGTAERILLETSAGSTQFQLKQPVFDRQNSAGPLSAGVHQPARQDGPTDEVRSLPSMTDPEPFAQSRAANMPLARYDRVSTFTPTVSPPRPALPAQPTTSPGTTQPWDQPPSWQSPDPPKASLAQHTESIHPPQDLGPQLDGYCPVDLIEHERWTPGRTEFAVVHRGRTFHTSGVEQQKRFLANPERYAPVLSGFDPVLLVEGSREVAGKTDFCLVYDGRLYAFSSRSTLAKFRESPLSYTELARQRGN